MLNKPKIYTNKNKIYPSFLNTYNSGKLEDLIKKSFSLSKSCSICPRRCKINRQKDKTGFCKIDRNAVIYNFMAHHGEEPPISGTQGSGTIFFSGCNMNCVYCQNFGFSQTKNGREVNSEELSNFMLQLQNIGCHNINLVTPTHVLPQILSALNLAIPKGLKIPLVYNTSGYELKETIELLNGIIDIYLTDMRYGDNASAVKYSNANNYPKYNQEAVKEMYRQAGTACFNSKGIIKKGLIIRHLIMPNNISSTDKIMKFISQEISRDTYISLMSQYTPFYKAKQFQEISRHITQKEYEEAQNIMQKYGLSNGWIQESFGLEEFAGINIKSINEEKK
ncbi:MAG: radical SAM protein [Candidatus Omnitrophota bacterium]